MKNILSPLLRYCFLHGFLRLQALLGVMLSAIALFSTSCLDTSTAVAEKQSTGSILPAAVGNYWAYADSAQTQFSTVSISGSYSYDGLTWWKTTTDTAQLVFLPDFALRNDTVFNLQRARGMANEFAAPVFVPAQANSLSFQFLVGGDAYSARRVTKHNSTITVPAGTFNNYISYVEDRGLEKDSLVFVPNVGLVARISEGIAYSGRPGFRKVIFLQSYKIQ